jgi:uncharacterized protein involved in exopolysaccharide biosynthesis
MSPYRSLTDYAALAAPAPAGFQLADLMGLIQARRRLILRVALAIIITAILLALALPTSWSSSAVVMMDLRKNNIADMSAVLSQLPGDPATLQDQVEILGSRGLAESVVAKLKLADDPEFNPQLSRPGLSQIAGELVALLNPRNWSDDGARPGAAQIHDQVLERFGRHVFAETNGLSTAITITATSRDPAKAARIANALAEAYIASQVEVKRDAADAATHWLNQRIQNLALQLQLQESAAQTYKARNGLTDTAPGNSLVDQQLVGINAQIVQARSDVAEKQATLDRINQLSAAGNIADISSAVASPLILQLRTQEAQLVKDEADLASKYGPLHPKLQAAEEQKRDLDNKIAEEVRRIAGAAGNDLTVAKAHLQSLEASLGSARGQLTGENYARVQLQALESNAAQTRAQYEAIVARLRQTQDQGNAAIPDSRIISPAATPLRPSGPRRTLMVAASIPFGLLLGLLAALGAEKFATAWPADGRAALRPSPQGLQGFHLAQPPRPPQANFKPKRVPTPMPAWHGPPILAEIGDGAPLKAGDYVLDYPKSAYAFSVAALARQLESRPVQGRPAGAAVVAVTAAEAGENKSAIGVSLARAAALMGKKTLLVDCDPAQFATAGMRVEAKSGLYDVLTGRVPLARALARDPRTSAKVLAMQTMPPNLSTMFASSQMTKLLEMLRRDCDLVVIDCARAGAGPETALLARLADATVLVSRQAALYGPSLAKSVNLLQSAKAAPIGIVVTR